MNLLWRWHSPNIPVKLHRNWPWQGEYLFTTTEEKLAALRTHHEKHGFWTLFVTNLANESGPVRHSLLQESHANPTQNHRCHTTPTTCPLVVFNSPCPAQEMYTVKSSSSDKLLLWTWWPCGKFLSTAIGKKIFLPLISCLKHLHGPGVLMASMVSMQQNQTPQHFILKYRGNSAQGLFFTFQASDTKQLHCFMDWSVNVVYCFSLLADCLCWSWNSLYFQLPRSIQYVKLALNKQVEMKPSTTTSSSLPMKFWFACWPFCYNGAICAWSQVCSEHHQVHN